MPWHVLDDELSSLIKTSRHKTLASSKRPPRLPYTPQYITALHARLNLEKPFDAAVFACLTTCFYSCARLGEFTVPTLSSFDPSRHVSPRLVSEERDRQGLMVTQFALPFTKTSSTGEEVFWAAQAGPTNPRAALDNHLQINSPPPSGHLFAYKYKKGYRPMTKHDFLKRLDSAAREAGLTPLHGHSIRIGGTLELLLCGIPFDVVKTMGRWSSDAFTGYLRRHAQILVPYLQDSPELHNDFVRLAMPRPRS